MNQKQEGSSVSTGSLFYLTNTVTSKLLFQYAHGQSNEWATLLKVKDTCLTQYTFPFVIVWFYPMMTNTDETRCSKIHECIMFKSVVFIPITKTDVYINTLKHATKKSKCKVPDEQNNHIPKSASAVMQNCS